MSENVSERERLIQALLIHRLSYNGACACGGRADSANPIDLTRHVADALLAAGFGDVAQAKADGIKEAEDAIRANRVFYGKTDWTDRDQKMYNRGLDTAIGAVRRTPSAHKATS